MRNPGTATIAAPGVGITGSADQAINGSVEEKNIAWLTADRT